MAFLPYFVSLNISDMLILERLHISSSHSWGGIPVCVAALFPPARLVACAVGGSDKGCTSASASVYFTISNKVFTF